MDLVIEGSFWLSLAVLGVQMWQLQNKHVLTAPVIMSFPQVAPSRWCHAEGMGPDGRRKSSAWFQKYPEH